MAARGRALPGMWELGPGMGLGLSSTQVFKRRASGATSDFQGSSGVWLDGRKEIPKGR